MPYIGTKSQGRYRTLLRTGEFYDRVDQAKASLTNCQVCPRHCGIDRVHGERGTCLVGAKALGQRLR